MKITIKKLHLIQAAGHLSLSACADIFIDILGKEVGNDLSSALGNALQLFGESATTLMKNSWGNLNGKQRLYLIEILSRFSDNDLHTYIIDGWNEMRENHLKIWCNIVKISGDSRIIDFMESIVEKSPSLLDIGIFRQAYLDLCNLLDITPPLFEQFKNHKLSTPHNNDDSPFLNLEMKCPHCNELSDYEVKNIFVTMGFHLEHPYIGGDIKCHYCGNRPDFQLTKSGFSRFVQEFGKVANLMSSSTQFKSAVTLIEPFLLDGKKVSMSTTVSFYRNELIKLPNSPSTSLHLGHLYHKIKNLDAALEQFSRTLTLDPANIEAALFTGIIYEERGLFNEALRVMMNTASFKNRWTFYISKKQDRKEIGESFATLYNHLIKELSAGINPLHPDFLIEQKFGKNSQCPCGSGKKYKKCCLWKNIY
jgi:tetratricopeptide (TPR) repeat protein